MSIAPDPRDARTVTISMYNNGVLRSRDGGATWQSITDGLPAAREWSIVASNLDGSVLHATTMQHSMWELFLTETRRRAVGPR
jgi:hypothetical protein